MKKIFQLAIMACTALSVHATDYTRGLSIWFDTPNTLVNKAVWFGNTPNMWKGENKPELPVILRPIRMQVGNRNRSLSVMAAWAPTSWVR